MQCKKCKSKNIILVEYGLIDRPDADKYYYDGWSEYECRDCKVRIGRWSDATLKEGELETKYNK